MDKEQIEQFVTRTIKLAFEDRIGQVIAEVNSKGYRFARTADDPTRWRDDEKRLELEVWASVAAGCQPQKEDLSPGDREKKLIEEAFYSEAERNPNSEASILAMFEADIENGGFEQLHENKGTDFIRKALKVLRAIGSRGKFNISSEALRAMEGHAGDIRRFRQYQKALLKLDSRYFRSAENIPVLFNKSQSRRRSRPAAASVGAARPRKRQKRVK